MLRKSIAKHVTMGLAAAALAVGGTGCVRELQPLIEAANTLSGLIEDGTSNTIFTGESDTFDDGFDAWGEEDYGWYGGSDESSNPFSDPLSTYVSNYIEYE